MSGLGLLSWVTLQYVTLFSGFPVECQGVAEHSIGFEGKPFQPCSIMLHSIGVISAQQAVLPALLLCRDHPLQCPCLRGEGENQPAGLN
jgi:hypothetical protein